MSRSSEPLHAIDVRITAPLKSVNQQIFRALLSIASAALLVRVFGMFNQIIVTGRFGAGATMDAYFVASALPILLAQLASSAIESSIIPVYARVRRQGKEQASILFSTSLNLLMIGGALLTVLTLTLRYQLIHLSAPALDPFRTGLAISLAPFIFPVLLLMVVISFLECILNTEGQFGWPAYAGLLVPLTTAVLVLTMGSSQGVVMLCLGTLLGLCLQLCVVIVRAGRAGLAYRLILDLRNPELGRVLAVAWPVLIAALISQASPLVDQVFASYLSAGSISAISYSLKLISVPVGVIFISVGRAALPYLSRQASMNDMKAFKETLRLYLWAVGSGTIALTAFMLVLAHPLVRILFQHGAFSADDTSRTASTLMGFVVGLAPMSLGFIASKAFSALGKTRVLMSVTLTSVIANAVFDYIFARLWQSQGIALATSAVYFCTMFILFFMLRHMIGKLYLFTPPVEVLKVIGKIDQGSYYLRSVNLRRQFLRLGFMIAVFAVGVLGISRDSLYTLRAAFGSLVVLAFLRYRYALLITWVLVNAFIGSTVPIFHGNKFDTALTVPTLLLMTCMPIKQTFQRMPALAFLFIYLMWIFASIGISALSVGTFLTRWLLLLDDVAVGVLTIQLLTTQRRLMRLIDAILLISTVISLYGIYGYITKQNGVIDPGSRLFRISSIFGATGGPGASPTGLAFFLSIIIPFAIYRTFTLRGAKRVSGSIVVLVLLVAVGLTFTRAAYISIPLSIVIMIFFLPSRKMKISLLSGISALAALMVLLTIVGDFPFLGRFLNQDTTTLNGRTYIWNALLNNFDPTQLLGHGFDASYAFVASTGLVFGRGQTAVAPHNLFLGTLYDNGIIGVTLLALVFISLFVNLIIGMRKATPDHRLMLATALATFINVLLQSLDSNAFLGQAIGIYFWILIALPFALCWSTPKQSREAFEEDLDEEKEPLMKAVQPTRQEQVVHA